MWCLIKKDLHRRWRSPLSTIVMIVFPLFMTLAIGSISGGSGGEEFPRIKVLVQNLDENGFISNTIVGMLGQENAQEYLEIIVVGDEGPAMMENGKASAMVVIPDSFTVHVLDRRPTTLTVVRNPAEGIKPEIIAQGTGAVATYLDQAARLLGAELGAISSMLEADEVPESAKVGAVAASMMLRIDGAQDYLFPPLLKLGTVKEADEEDEGGGGGSIYGYILIMTTVMALLFVATRTMGDLFEEQNNGMLRRQLATPLTMGLVVRAKIVFGVIFGVIVLAILAVIGLAAGWIGAGVDPVGTVLLGLTFSLAACGVLSLVTSMVRTEKQAGIANWLVIMGMSAIGGSMFPYENMPAVMQKMSHYTINYWAIDGFKELVFNGAHTAGIGTHLMILLAMGLVTNAAAQGLLVRRFRGLVS
jgi:ABC-type multidrug transport system permease subunit